MVILNVLESGRVYIEEHNRREQKMPKKKHEDSK